MMRDVNNFVKPVINERFADIIDDPAVGIPGESDRSGPFAHPVHMMGGVAIGDDGGVDDRGLL
jgi:hypothetical protein